MGGCEHLQRIEVCLLALLRQVVLFNGTVGIGLVGYSCFDLTALRKITYHDTEPRKPMRQTAQHDEHFLFLLHWLSRLSVIICNPLQRSSINAALI